MNSDNKEISAFKSNKSINNTKTDMEKEAPSTSTSTNPNSILNKMNELEKNYKVDMENSNEMESKTNDNNNNVKTDAVISSNIDKNANIVEQVDPANPAILAKTIQELKETQSTEKAITTLNKVETGNTSYLTKDKDDKIIEEKSNNKVKEIEIKANLEKNDQNEDNITPRGNSENCKEGKRTSSLKREGSLKLENNKFKKNVSFVLDEVKEYAVEKEVTEKEKVLEKSENGSINSDEENTNRETKESENKELHSPEAKKEEKKEEKKKEEKEPGVKNEPYKIRPSLIASLMNLDDDEEEDEAK